MKKIRIFALLLALILVISGCSSRDLAYDSKNESFDGGYWI